MRLSKQEVESLMVAQSELNEAFTVSRWDDPLVTTAFLVEYGEMLNEIKPEWKVWKESEMSLLAAEVEFIDCIHFGLSILLLRAHEDEQGFQLGGDMCMDRPILKRTGDFLTDMNKSVTSFVSWSSSYPMSVGNFVDFIDIVTEHFTMDKERFMRFFEVKAKINRERVAQGYAQGNYTGKDDEIKQFV